MLHPSGDASKDGDQMVIPMEFKTGKPYFTHSAQVDATKQPAIILTLFAYMTASVVFAIDGDTVSQRSGYGVSLVCGST